MTLLSACAQLPGGSEKTSEDEEVSTQEADVDGETIVEVPFVKIPKPDVKSIKVPDSARSEFDAAKQAMSNKQWDDALNRLLFMTETYPELAGVYVNLGIVYTQLEKVEDAENAYRFAIEKNMLNFDAYINLGVLLREQGKFAEAEQVYLDALTLWPHHQASLINLGVLYDLYMGKLAEALVNFELAQKLNDEESRQLKGWIVDLQRRLPAE